MEWSMARNVEAVFMTWNTGETVSKDERNRWVKRTAKMGNDQYFHQRFEIDNTHCGGNIERHTIGLIIHHKRIECAMAGMNRFEWTSSMNSELDPGNHLYSDYLTVPITRYGDSESAAPRESRIEAYVAWDDAGTEVLPVFDPIYPAPDISKGELAAGDIEFCISTTDLGLSTSVRPIRRHELLSLVGFEKALTRRVRSGSRVTKFDPVTRTVTNKEAWLDRVYPHFF
jgi:hypothetical protein